MNTINSVNETEVVRLQSLLAEAEREIALLKSDVDDFMATANTEATLAAALQCELEGSHRALFVRTEELKVLQLRLDAVVSEAKLIEHYHWDAGDVAKAKAFAAALRSAALGCATTGEGGL